jgi:hypothetical protein
VPKENEAMGGITVAVDQYNLVVRRHNDFVMKYRGAIADRNKWIEYSKGQLRRANRLRLNSRALRTALSLAALSLVITIFVPAKLANTIDPRAVYWHPLALFIGAFIVAGLLTRKIAREVDFPPHVVAWWIGFIGCFSCGFITLAVSLPYQWRDIVHKPSPFPGVSIPVYVILIRLVLLPFAGFLGSLSMAAMGMGQTQPSSEVSSPGAGQSHVDDPQSSALVRIARRGLIG